MAAYMYTHAALICLIDSSSGKTQACHFGVPYDIHPSMILDTLSPELPRRTGVKDVTRLRSDAEERRTTYHMAFPFSADWPSIIRGKVRKEIWFCYQKVIFHSRIRLWYPHGTLKVPFNKKNGILLQQ
jgi:hypothetical protein